MPKTTKPQGVHRRKSSEVAVANLTHPVTLDLFVRIQAIAIPEADGGFTVVIPALGCATEGDTMEEARNNAVEATEGWLTSQHKRMADDAIRATR